MKFDFPIEPYSVQLRLATEIYSLLQEDSNYQIGIFESPTGTGKTLSVLCGILQWMLDHQRQSNDGETVDDVPDWIRKFQQTKQQKAAVIVSSEESDDELQKNKRMKSLLQQDARFLPIEYDNNESKVKIDGAKKKTKLIYCSRTHSQLSQVAKEFKSTQYSKHFKLQLVASRRQLCLNDKIIGKGDGSVHLINEKCIELGREVDNHSRCPFYSAEAASENSNILSNFSQTLLAEVRDIEDMQKLGKKYHTCPYYGARRGIEDADILLVPYNLILQENTRESIEIPLAQNIVVFDEAHNLPDCINGMYTISLSLSNINLLYGSFQRYFTKFQSRFSGNSSVSVKQLITILKAFKIFLTGQPKECRILELNEFLFQLSIDNINLFKLISFVKTSKICYKLVSYLEVGDGESIDVGVNVFFSFSSFLSILCLPETVGRIFINHCDDKDVELKFVSLHANYQMESLLQANVHRILLVGGTMQPIEFICKELFTSIDESKIKTYIGDHITDAKNVYCTILQKSLCNSEMTFNFTFANRANNELADECGKSLLEICSIVPNGVVAFFASYSQLTCIHKRWKEWGILGKLSQKKEIFVEEKGATFDLELFLRRYSATARNSAKGALLLGVIGGKLSEGINFSDELARCIVVVGMPYPNPNSPELQERLKGFSGNVGTFLDNVCMQSVNQSIGRAIRHKNDYAAIVLMDKRFANGSIRKKLPYWLNQCIREFASTTQFNQDLNVFFARNK